MKKLIQQRNHIAPSQEPQQRVPLFSRSRVKSVAKKVETDTYTYHFDAAQEACQFMRSADHNHPIVPKIQSSSKGLNKEKTKEKSLNQSKKRKQEYAQNKGRKKTKTTATSDDEDDGISIGDSDSEDEKDDDNYSDLDDFVVSECEDDITLND